MSTVASTIAAVIFTILMAIVVIFYFGLACGASWGAYCMGGRHPGRVPTKTRILIFVVQIPLFVVMALVVLARAGVAAHELNSSWVIWVVVAFMALASVLNLITSNKRERNIWAPIAILALASSLMVALGA